MASILRRNNSLLSRFTGLQSLKPRTYSSPVRHPEVPPSKTGSHQVANKPDAKDLKSRPSAKDPGHGQGKSRKFTIIAGSLGGMGLTTIAIMYQFQFQWQAVKSFTRQKWGVVKDQGNQLKRRVEEYKQRKGGDSQLPMKQATSSSQTTIDRIKSWAGRG